MTRSPVKGNSVRPASSLIAVRSCASVSIPAPCSPCAVGSRTGQRSQVRVEAGADGADGAQAAAVEPGGARAGLAQERRAMGDEDDRRPLPPELVDARRAFLLEADVAHRQHLV